MLLSVIIVAHNNRQELPQAIAALERHTARPEETEIIIIDSASSDDGLASITAGAIPLIKHREEGNVGFTGGCNIGAHRAQGEVLVFTQPDGELQPGWDEPLRQALQEPAVVAVGGLVLRGDGQGIDSAGLRIAPNLAAWSVAKHEPAEVTQGWQGRELIGASPAFVAVRASAHRASGGFWDELLLYGDEPDYALRLRRQGRIVLAPQAVMIHHEGASAGPRRSDLRLFFSARNRLWNCARHLPLTRLPLGLLCSLLFDLLALLEARRLSALGAVLRGWGEGLRGLRRARRLSSARERRGNLGALSSWREALAEQRRLSSVG